jgi:endonuclease/exonuclease/phosphatase family metal-dependent hydrolase
MVKLDVGNVLLKPSHRKQLMGWLRRAVRLGEREGDFTLTVLLERTGRRYEAKALVHNSAGDFNCRARQGDWRNAARDLAVSLAARLHEQHLARP